MCGRYSITTSPAAIRRLFKFKNATPNLNGDNFLAPAAWRFASVHSCAVLYHL